MSTNFTAVTIQHWPHCQLCMECKHGEFMQSTTFNNSDYICMVSATENNGIVCDKQEPIDIIPNENENL